MENIEGGGELPPHVPTTGHVPFQHDIPLRTYSPPLQVHIQYNTIQYFFISIRMGPRGA